MRDLLEALSSHLELHALSQAALERLLQHSGAAVGAVLVEVDRVLQVSAACGLPEIDRLTGAPEFLEALRTRTPRRLQAPQPGGTQLVITPVEFEHRALGCVVLPQAAEDDTQRLIALFARAFGVALNNALTHARFERLAALDPLTGDADRRAGLRALERETAGAHRDLRTLGVLMIDLDHFKQINERGGHLAGDHVLLATARANGGVLRDGDTLIRYGGEEFLVCSPRPTPPALTTPPSAHAGRSQRSPSPGSRSPPASARPRSPPARHFAAYAQQTGRSFDLYVRPNTRLSGPLQDAIANGTINLKFIP